MLPSKRDLSILADALNGGLVFFLIQLGGWPDCYRQTRGTGPDRNPEPPACLNREPKMVNRPEPKTLPGPQTYVEYLPFGLFLMVLGHYFTCCWGPGKPLTLNPKPQTLNPNPKRRKLDFTYFSGPGRAQIILGYLQSSGPSLA